MDENSIRELVASLVREEAILSWERIAIQALDWPFLLFLLVLIVVSVFRKNLAALFTRGHIELSWGKDKHIQLRDLSENIDQELDPIREDVEKLKETISHLLSAASEEERKAVPGPMSEEDRKIAKERMHKALRSPKFRWRTVKKLADFSRTTEDEILELIAEDENIVVGFDKAGQKLVKLKSR